MDLRIQREFLIDIEELVEQLFADTSELRRKENQIHQQRELLDRIFRQVHSIKGIALTAGFTDVSSLAHQTETLLDNARSGRVALADRFIDTLDEAANAISERLSAATEGSQSAPPLDFLQSFHNFEVEDETDADLPLPDLPQDLQAAINEREKQILREAVRENENLYLVISDFALGTFDQEFQELRSILTKRGTIICSLPSADSARPDRVVFRVLVSSSLESADIKAQLAQFPQALVEVLNCFADAHPNPVRKDEGIASQREATSSQAGTSVRIQVEDLDSLISSAHELFGQTVSALDLISSTLTADSHVELKNLDAQIRESLSSLEHRIIQLRMVSLDRVMQRAVRAGRVAAKVRGKEINFITVGGDLHIDKTLLDAVADPLLHLVRNAVDQGIELPAARVAAGKPATGLVRIEATSVGGRVRFVVSDNGRGIDPRVISAAAARLGIIEAGALLSDEKSLRLIFRPGFSTAIEVSSVSGRGVGLDIVEKAIEKVGGSVRVRTQVGLGSEFEIRLPTSLGVMRAVVLRSGDFRYCVDADLVVDRCAPKDIANDRLKWQDEVLPVIPLRSLISQANGQPNPDPQVLICAFPGEDSDKARHAIAVDDIESTQEILVRSLGRHGAMWPGIVGATELFDGTVALVLDLPLLLSQHQ